MSDDTVTACAQRLLEAARKYVAEHGNGPIAPNMYADIQTVATWALGASNKLAAMQSALEEISEGCGHERCHAFPWIRLARKTLTR